MLGQLSHYKFRQHLQNKCSEYGCNLFVKSEEYSSKCCGNCGYLSSNYSNDRIKCCPKCFHKIDRDINGARNIFLKNIEEIIGCKTVTNLPGHKEL